MTGCCSTSRRWRAGWAPAATRSSSRCPTASRRTRPRARPPGQGPLHAAAGDGARGRRPGVAAPRAAARRRRPRRSAGRRRGPALGAARDRRRRTVRRRPRGPGDAARRLRDDRRRRAARLVLADGRRAAVAPAGSTACITTGQSFGGDLEAVTVHTGLLAARHVVGADLVVVAQGPGNLGTGTRWGFSGVAAGEAVNAAGDARRSTGRVAAGLGRGPARTSPRRLAPLADRLRPGRAGARRRRRPAARRESSVPASATRPPRSASGTGSSRSPAGPDLLSALDGLARPAVDDGPRPRPGPGGVPRRRRGRGARGRAVGLSRPAGWSCAARPASRAGAPRRRRRRRRPAGCP